MAQVLNAPGRGRSRGAASGISVPSWRLAMAPGTWAEVPVAASLSTLNPNNDPALNPNYPSTKPEYMSSGTTSWNAMFSAWNGGAWDEERQRWSNVRSGGHADNASNEQFGLSLFADSPAWTRTTPPSGADGSVITNDQARLVSGSGSTVVLPSGSQAPLLWNGTRDEASAVDDAYNGMTLDVFGQTARTITDYDGATKTATVSPAYSVDMADKLFSIRNGPMVMGLKGEQTGRYSDGRMRSIHSYNRIIYVPAADAYFVPVIGSTSWTASQGTYEGCKIDRATGAETFFGPAPSPLSGFGPSGSGSCLDTTRGDQGTIWWMGTNGSRFGKLDVATLTWSTSASIGAQSGATSLCRLPGDLILMGFTGGGFKVFDCAAEALHTPTFSGTAAGGVSDYGQAQPVYVAADNAVYWWNNPTGSTAVLNRMVVPANPKTDAWTITQTTPAGENAVTPSARQTNGTYGRFCYSALLDGFLLLNAVDGPVYFYARADL